MSEEDRTKSTACMSGANRLPSGHDDGGYREESPTKALFVNLYELKQVVRVLRGTSAYAQLAGPPPAFHTGYFPVVIILLVKTNPYIFGYDSELPSTRIPPLVSGNPVM